MTTPTRTMRCQSPAAEHALGRRPRRAAHRGRVGGSLPRATPGSPWVSRLTQRIWAGSSGRARPRNGPASMTAISAQSAGQPVEQEPADVGVDPAALLGGRDDGAEFVVGQDQVGGLAGDLGASLAHRDPDVGAAQRGAVVHAVAGHGHHVAGRLPGRDDGELLLWRGPGEHRAARATTCASRATSPAVDHFESAPAGADDADVRGDGAGRGGVVAGDEHRGDASGLAGRDGRGRGRPGRVEDADEPEQAKARTPVPTARGKPGRSAAATARTRKPSRGKLVGPAERAWIRSRRRRLITASGQHGLRCPFADDPDAAGRQPVRGGHPLAAAVEGHLGDAGKPLAQVCWASSPSLAAAASSAASVGSPTAVHSRLIRRRRAQRRVVA